MSSPRVSVLFPCYNVAATLDEALSSMVEQTFRDFEILAMDDGSSDGTREILERWRRREPRIRTYRLTHGGIVTAMNRAASIARGELLARMDADDIACPRRLETQMALMDAHPELAGCGTRIRYFPRRAIRGGARRYETWINSVVTPAEVERDLFVECPIPHPTLLLKHATFEAIGGYRDVPWPEDYDLIFRLWSAGYRLGKTVEVLLEWRESPERLSRTDERYGKEAFLQCKVEFLPRLIHGRPVIVWGTGPVGRHLARALSRNGECVQGFVSANPAQAGQSIRDRPVLDPSSYPAAGHFHIAAVGSLEARVKIRATLADAGLQEMKDYCVVA